MKTTKLAAVGCLFAGIAVGIGAFAAHGLKSHLSAYHLSIVDTGVQYQFWHGLGIIALGYWQMLVPSRLLIAAGGFFVLGVLLFSGSLYGLAFTNWSWLWPLTPLGGMSFLLGWSLATVSLWRAKN